MYGINPIINPSKKNFVKKIFLFVNKYGDSAAKGTTTRKVFIIKAKPIQIPKSRMKNLLLLDFILTKENTPIVTKQEKIRS